MNVLDLIAKWNQFQTMIKNKDVTQLLDAELKKRNISRSELNNLVNQAKQLSNLLGRK